MDHSGRFSESSAIRSPGRTPRLGETEGDIFHALDESCGGDVVPFAVGTIIQRVLFVVTQKPRQGLNPERKTLPWKFLFSQI